MRPYILSLAGIGALTLVLRAAGDVANPTTVALLLLLAVLLSAAKTYQMLEDAHLLTGQGFDIVIGFIEPHGRADTSRLTAGLEQMPLRVIEYRGVRLREMDVDAIEARRPQIVLCTRSTV